MKGTGSESVQRFLGGKRGRTGWEGKGGVREKPSEWVGGWSELREFPKEEQGGGNRGATWVVKARA